jgi:hypothetical protein
MNFLKKLTGLLVFVIAIVGAVAVSRYFSGPRAALTDEATAPQPPPGLSVAPVLPSDPQLLPVSPPGVIKGAPPARVFFKARLVTLDFKTQKSHITLDLERDRARPAPERVWAWVSFFSPADGGRCAGEPVEVRQPFARGDRATVVVEADASRCAPPREPAATVYARVNVSSESAAAARLPAAQLDADISKATPVVVAGAGAGKN